MLTESKNIAPCTPCRRMRLKRNYKFQMYEDSIKGQAPAAGQAADAHLRAHLPLPGQHFLRNSLFNSFSFCMHCVQADRESIGSDGTNFIALPLPSVTKHKLSCPGRQCNSWLSESLSHGASREGEPMP